MGFSELKMYKDVTSDTLSQVELNHEMILCDNPHCVSQSHKNAIYRMYSDIERKVSVACKGDLEDRGIKIMTSWL